MKVRYFCSSHCAHSYAGSQGWNKRRKGSQSHRIKKLWENKKAYNQFRRITFLDILNRYFVLKKVALFFLIIFPFFLINNSSFNRVEKDYDDWRLEHVFYTRSLGLRIDREIIERIFDYSVRFNKNFDLMLCWTYAESRFEPTAISIVGAMGLLQVMPRTADRVVTLSLFDYEDRFGWTIEERERIREGYDLFDIEDNFLIAFTFINMLERSSNNLAEVIAKYYAGGGFRSYLTDSYVLNIRGLTPIKNRKAFSRI